MWFWSLFPLPTKPAVKSVLRSLLSSNSYNQSHPDVIIMPITSQMESAVMAAGVRIIEWEKAGLLKPSMVKPIIATVEKKLVLKQLGKLGAGDLQILQALLSQILN